MTKYYTYVGKEVGFIRKAVGEVVSIEEAWISEINKHLASKGYDSVLEPIAKILESAGQPSVTRAQAWVLLHVLTNQGVPEALQDADSDEKIGAVGSFVKKTTQAAAGAVDTVANPVGKVVGGATSGVVGKLKKSEKASDEE
jgi:hypothetical protein